MCGFLKRYLKEVFGLNVPNGFGNAIDYYGFNNKKLLNNV